MNVLVVGGAGYIGSFCVRQLAAAGYRPIVLDNLVFGHRRAIAPEVTFYQGDLGDEVLIARILRSEKIELVMHFAAFAYVEESVEDPLKYYRNNLVKPITMISTMLEAGVKKFVLSSSCTIFGEPEHLPLGESSPLGPISPYGQTKLDLENFLSATARANGLSFASLRYFNAAGASKDGSIGEDHEPETHLIPLAIEAATGIRGPLTVFGTDYETPDGSCLRDFIHVEDLCRAHIAVFEKLEEPSSAWFYNLGTGIPTSVREVIATVERVTRARVPIKEGPRRDGDAPALYADAQRAHKELSWNLRFPRIDEIVRTAWEWHRRHPNGYAD